jgi:hypothetical protein
LEVALLTFLGDFETTHRTSAYTTFSSAIGPGRFFFVIPFDQSPMMSNRKVGVCALSHAATGVLVHCKYRLFLTIRIFDMITQVVCDDIGG